MTVDTHAIVLSVHPYSDGLSIATLYTEQCGAVAYRVPQGRSKAGNMRRLVEPLTELQISADHSPRREVQTLREVTPAVVRLSLVMHPVKRQMRFFLAELLSRFLTDRHADGDMYRFLSYSLERLEQVERGVENFHLAFLIRLLDQLGLSPHGDKPSYGEVWFDLQEMEFLAGNRGGHVLPPHEGEWVPLMMRMNYDNMHHYRFRVEQRRRLLEILLRIFQLHFMSFRELKTLQVLASLSI